MNIGEIELKLIAKTHNSVTYSSEKGAHVYTIGRKAIQDERGRLPKRITVKIWVEPEAYQEAA